MAINQGMFSANKDDWETPQDLFNQLNAKYHFTLDAAASDTNHKCDKYFTREQDGLAQDWSGETVFINPPYGRAIADWVKKAYETHRRGGQYNRYVITSADGYKMVS